MNRYPRLALVLFVSCSLAVSAAAQTTWYVDASAAPPGNGTAASPYASIQYAISRSRTVDGDTLLVLPGTYFENVDFLGKAIKVFGRDGAADTRIDASDNGSV